METIKTTHLDITSVPTKYINAFEMFKYFEKNQKKFVDCIFSYAVILQKTKANESMKQCITDLARRLIFFHTESEFHKFLKEFIPLSDFETCKEFVDEWYFLCSNCNDILDVKNIRELKLLLNNFFE